MHLAQLALPLLAVFNTKLRLFVNGRKRVFDELSQKIKPGDQTIWIHAASLGEFEQGLPILERLKTDYPSHKFIVTFFSPSGYEVKKNSGVAHVITYLPLDTPQNAKKFVKACRPKMAIFIKYEVWPNFLGMLEKEGIPTLLVSALFRERQSYFKWYGGGMRKTLFKFSKIFVQDAASQKLLERIGIQDSEISGDTRFDRVAKIAEADKQLDFMVDFKGNHTCFVVGSSWPEDEAVLLDFINTNRQLKTVIAPHNITPKHSAELQAKLHHKTVLYSKIDGVALADVQVLIIDTIGLLTKIYSYADFAYVGGGFKTGLHNTLEPVVFGIPVIVGPHYTGFAEAEALVALGGAVSVENEAAFTALGTKMLNDPKWRLKLGAINHTYIQKNMGATTHIVGYIKEMVQGNQYPQNTHSTAIRKF